VNDSFDRDAANEKKWTRRAAHFDDRSNDIFRFLQWTLISTLKITPPCAFLDLGCGTGWAVRYVARLLAGKGIFVGVDLSIGMIEKARANAAGMQHVTFHQANADDLPFEDNLFDTVICSNSFHHYSKPILALQEARRVLKPGGQIHILDITADDFFIRWIDRRARLSEKEHVKFYGSGEYAGMFSRAGLTYIRSSHFKILYPLKVHQGQKERR
jgi:ubiquinone/menaquinone biosynthesis C-methylase UbiE